MENLSDYSRYQETVDEFMDRTFWDGVHNKVIIYANKNQRNNMLFEPIDIVDMDVARFIVEELEEYTKKEKKPIEEIKNEKCK